MKNLIATVIVGTFTLSAGAAFADSEFDNLEAFFSNDSVEAASTSDFNLFDFRNIVVDTDIEVDFEDQGNRE